MPLLSEYARKRKCRYFIDRIPKTHRVLEVGCGDGWLGAYMRAGGWGGYVGLDVVAPADVVGAIEEWRDLALEAASFDVVVAFEVVEHTPCFQEMFDLLKPGGLLMLTSPAPGTDWVCWLLERLGLAQKRTGSHDYLIDFAELPLFEPVEIRRVGLLAQWGILRKGTAHRSKGQ